MNNSGDFCQQCGKPFARGFECPNCGAPREAAPLSRKVFFFLCFLSLEAIGAYVIYAEHYVAFVKRTSERIDSYGLSAIVIGTIWLFAGGLFLSAIPDGRVGKKIFVISAIGMLSGMILLWANKYVSV